MRNWHLPLSISKHCSAPSIIAAKLMFVERKNQWRDELKIFMEMTLCYMKLLNTYHMPGTVFGTVQMLPLFNHHINFIR